MEKKEQEPHELHILKALQKMEGTTEKLKQGLAFYYV